MRQGALGDPSSYVFSNLSLIFRFEAVFREAGPEQVRYVEHLLQLT